MKRTITAMLITLVIIYLVPFVVYGLFAAAGLVQTPEGPPGVFLLSVLVDKLGVAVAFVLIYRLAREGFAGRWWLYAVIWWIMFVFGELGQAPGPYYTWMEALAGVISEAIYFPLAGWVVWRILRTGALKIDD
ncbi:MAG: hypothetical protein V3W14_08740 [Candidatus Neomarinimicrobiota bacterium]